MIVQIAIHLRFSRLRPHLLLPHSLHSEQRPAVVHHVGEIGGVLDVVIVVDGVGNQDRLVGVRVQRPSSAPLGYGR